MVRLQPRTGCNNFTTNFLGLASSYTEAAYSAAGLQRFVLCRAIVAAALPFICEGCTTWKIGKPSESCASHHDIHFFRGGCENRSLCVRAHQKIVFPLSAERFPFQRLKENHLRDNFRSRMSSTGLVQKFRMIWRSRKKRNKTITILNSCSCAPFVSSFPPFGIAEKGPGQVAV